MKKLFVILVLVIVSAGCAVQPYSSNPAYANAPQPVEGQSAADAQATLTAWGLQIAAVERESIAATSAAFQATSSASQSATSSAQDILDSQQSTLAAISAEAIGTAAALDNEEREIQINIEGQRLSNSIIATAEARVEIMAISEGQRLAEERRLQQIFDAQQARIERTRLVNAAIPYLILFFVLCISVGLIAIIILVRQRGTQIVQMNGGDVAILRGKNGITQLMAPKFPALVAGIGDIVDGEIERDTSTPPFELLSAWSNRKLALLGRNVDDMKPITIDRDATPHVLIAGTTGTGKTIGGLIPYALSMFSAGVNVIIANGKGSDFQGARAAGHDNFIVFPKYSTAQEGADQLVSILGAIVNEGARRDGILEQYSKRSWRDLPQEAEESGEIVVLIDELLWLVKRKRVNQQTVDFIWSSLNDIASVSRKYGFFIGVTVTDPTKRNMGNEGMELRGQSSVVAFGMQLPAASRSLLGTDKQSGYSKGSAGLQRGQFISNIGGVITRGAAFHPQDDDIRRLIVSDRRPRRPIPESVALLLQGQESAPAPRITMGGGTNSNGRPAPDLNVTIDSGEKLTWKQVGEIRAMKAAGKTGIAIQERVIGYKNGAAYYACKEVLERYPIGNEEDADYLAY